MCATDMHSLIKGNLLACLLIVPSIKFWPPSVGVGWLHARKCYSNFGTTRTDRLPVETAPDSTPTIKYRVFV